MLFNVVNEKGLADYNSAPSCRPLHQFFTSPAPTARVHRTSGCGQDTCGGDAVGLVPGGRSRPWRTT